MSLRESRDVPLAGVDDVEREGSGKKVVDARLRLEERHGPTPARHVVALETRDGAVYRFQRYGTDEYLAFYNRQNPDGSEFRRRAALPEHVQAVRRAIMDREVLPEFEPMMEAMQQVGMGGESDVPTQDEEPALDPPQGATDAEVREAVQAAEQDDDDDGWRLPRLARGYPQEKAARKRRAEQVATDGGVPDDCGHPLWTLCSDPPGAIECVECGEVFEGATEEKIARLSPGGGR